MVLDENFKNKGYGTQICKKFLDEILGIRKLYLLTCTAKGFFAKMGLESIPRQNVPDNIKTTKEFSNLCPSTAICMRKVLDKSN